MNTVESGAMARLPALSGIFYPKDEGRLRAEVRTFLHQGDVAPGPAPRAVIAPHAGYRYSGQIAGRAFRLIPQSGVDVVFLLGPAHRVYVQGIALPTARVFCTPLGDVPLEETICSELLELPLVCESAEAHENEHSLEVEIPFLQVALQAPFRIVPLLVGDCRPGLVAQILERYFDRPGTFFVVSSDLSHFLDYEAGRRKDAKTMDRILSLAAPDLDGDDACGCRAINGLIEFASHRGLLPRALCLQSSGDTGGGRDRVVGYGAMGFWERPEHG